MRHPRPGDADLWAEADQAFRSDLGILLDIARGHWDPDALDRRDVGAHDPKLSVSTNYKRGCRCEECLEWTAAYNLSRRVNK